MPKTKRCMMKMEHMPNPNEMKKMMMKKCMKCIGHMEELVKLNKQILAELKKLNKSKQDPDSSMNHYLHHNVD